MWYLISTDQMMEFPIALGPVLGASAAVRCGVRSRPSGTGGGTRRASAEVQAGRAVTVLSVRASCVRDAGVTGQG